MSEFVLLLLLVVICLSWLFFPVTMLVVCLVSTVVLMCMAINAPLIEEDYDDNI